jgi:hypothetical protein
MPVFREVGGVAASYARLGDTADWVRTVTALLREAQDNLTHGASGR